MSDLAERFRKRAKECRKLAAETPDVLERSGLTKTADELGELADLMEVEIERVKTPEAEGDGPATQLRSPRAR